MTQRTQSLIDYAAFMTTLEWNKGRTYLDSKTAFEEFLNMYLNQAKKRTLSEIPSGTLIELLKAMVEEREIGHEIRDDGQVLLDAQDVYAAIRDSALCKWHHAQCVSERLVDKHPVREAQSEISVLPDEDRIEAVVHYEICNAGADIDEAVERIMDTIRPYLATPKREAGAVDLMAGAKAMHNAGYTNDLSERESFVQEEYMDQARACANAWGLKISEIEDAPPAREISALRLREEFVKRMNEIPLGAEDIQRGASSYNWGKHHIAVIDEILAGMNLIEGGQS